jgi:hypothetical protein
MPLTFFFPNQLWREGLSSNHPFSASAYESIDKASVRRESKEDVRGSWAGRWQGVEFVRGDLWEQGAG